MSKKQTNNNTKTAIELLREISLLTCLTHPSCSVVSIHASTRFPAIEDLEVTIFDRLCYLALCSTAIRGGAPEYKWTCASHFYTNQTINLYNRCILQNTQAALSDSFFFFFVHLCLVGQAFCFVSPRVGAQLFGNFKQRSVLTRWRTLPSPHPQHCCASARRTVSCWSFFFWLPRSRPASCNCTAAKAAGRLVHSPANLSVTPHGHWI